MDSVLRCRNIHVTIAGKPVVRDFNLQLRPGEFWGLMGPNGVGKTTLLHNLAGLRKLEAGTICLGQDDIHTAPRRRVARQLGLLLQHTQYVFDASVLQTALMGRHPYLGLWQQESAADRQWALNALEEVDLAALAERSVTTLSGGEARRLALAVLRVQDPQVMLLDEPTNHLDLHHQTLIMRQISDAVSNQGKAAIAALHDVNLVARWCSHVVMLTGTGDSLQGKASELLTAGHLSRLYQQEIEKVPTEHGPRYFPLG